VIPDELRATSDPSIGYIDSIKRERELWNQHLTGTPSLLVDKIHLGGGTPTFLSPAQLYQLWEALGVGRSWTLKDGAELAAEVDPRVTTDEHLRTLWDLGFRRISLGVQDFDAIVQGKINRIQSFDLVKKSVDLARKVGFKQINFDLIYGLPGQTTETILKTLALAISLSPTRVAFYRLAVMPEIFKWQRTFRTEDLPNGTQTLEFMLLALQYFQSINYQFIGFDHFASPEDPLYHDYHSHKLVRNFQGMTTGSSPITIGLGPSAISSGPSFYAQNPHKTNAWVQSLTAGLPTQKGHRLTPQDQTRRLLLQELYCYGTLSDLSSLHSKELDSLATLTDEGLLAKTPSGFKVTLLGQLLTRVIGSALDPYLPEGAWRTGLTAGKNSAAG
jgi:oxygen-independent coproporphyrinogen-3 oxidase